MRCPQCQTDDDKVIETRVLANGAMLRRRRQCVSCDHRFTSYERVELQNLTIIKKNNQREDFSREKMTRGIQNAVRKRPITVNQIKHILDAVEETAWIEAGKSGEVSSSFIGEAVMSHLHEIDPVAYLRFASVYRNFESIEQFIQEISELSKNAILPPAEL